MEIFNEDYGDLRGLCEKDFYVPTICEGCGWIYVDHEGVCQGGCMEEHTKTEWMIKGERFD